jgi:hypothetical protein
MRYFLLTQVRDAVMEGTRIVETLDGTFIYNLEISKDARLAPCQPRSRYRLIIGNYGLHLKLITLYNLKDSIRTVPGMARRLGLLCSGSVARAATT